MNQIRIVPEQRDPLDVLRDIRQSERHSRNTRQYRGQETAVRLRFLGKQSTPDDSPTLYASDSESYIVQGYVVTDPAVLALLDVSDNETLVEVPANLMDFLAKDGLDGTVGNLVPPIVHVLENGNYIVQGPRLLDAEALSQMKIPDHETCVEISTTAVRALLVGA